MRFYMNNNYNELKKNFFSVIFFQIYYYLLISFRDIINCNGMFFYNFIYSFYNADVYIYIYTHKSPQSQF